MLLRRAPKVGDREWAIYAVGEVRVRVDYLVTKVCDPKDESCEVTYYKATLTVTRKSQRTAIKTSGFVVAKTCTQQQQPYAA